MAAYIVLIRDRVRDPAGYAAYGAAARETLARHAAKPLAFTGPVEALEGPPADGVIIIEFPTMAEARAWYDGPDYVAARQQRFASADFRVIMTEGLPAA